MLPNATFHNYNAHIKYETSGLAAFSLTPQCTTSLCPYRMRRMKKRACRIKLQPRPRLIWRLPGSVEFRACKVPVRLYLCWRLGVFSLRGTFRLEMLSVAGVAADLISINPDLFIL